MKTYDIVILGGGPGGYVGALRAAQKGASVALIEKRNLGGVCLNEGCIPTKALLDTCHTAHRAGTSVDIAAAVDSKDAMVKKLRGGVGHLLKGRGVDVVSGPGRIESAGQVTVEGSDPVGYKNLIICSGSRPVEIPALPFNGENIISSSEALNLRDAPESILVVGGGFIGCEFADLFAGLGSKVTLVEMLPGILPGMDRDLAGAVASELERSGVKVMLETKVEGIKQSEGGITAEISPGEAVTVQKILVAVGRAANTDIGDLSSLRINFSPGGIEIDEHCATSAAGIYAAGDVTGKWMLAHVASKEAEVAVASALGEEATIDYSAIPQCVFAAPEVSCVGITEETAKEEGIEIKTAKFPYAALGRAIVTGDDNGFVKVIGGPDSDVLGVQVAGRGASEIVALGGLAIQVGAAVEDLADMIVMHPTFSEAVREAADAWLGRALHVAK